jgi:hypothetical protein
VVLLPQVLAVAAEFVLLRTVVAEFVNLRLLWVLGGRPLRTALYCFLLSHALNLEHKKD